MLLTVTFDPVHDPPDVLRNYARTWKVRDGKLVANLEGNEFTAQQFADLLKTVLDAAK